ncbi:hypothetical protein PCANC_02684 [Puccinia coronata f. sp. avenae]|uniref:Integrase catalytic domain-containing protein n=1 Tax=Puccinia coronata f. sp. avenae TaxID=200324 RepID=A0A2N5VYC1_9BASI|nr:hypothetical protein PCANC_02684 [Puccinia coronata f. sp. avenae]
MLPTAAPLLHLRGDNTNVHLANQSTVEATKKGLLLLPLSVKTEVKALVVPSLHEPLLSVANLCDKDLRVVFTKDGCDIYSSTDLPLTSKPVRKGYRRRNLYYLSAEPVSSNLSLVSSATPAENSLLGYHICFSHIGLRPLKQLFKLGGIAPTILNKVDFQQCPVCVQSKLPRRELKSRQPYRLKEPGELIHSDVGSHEVNLREGYRYYVTFVDDCSKFTFVFPMKFKNNVFNCFKLFRASFEKDGKHPIRALRSDNGGEYISTEFTSYLASAGICHEPGPSHSPELNGVAERTNRTISNHIQCALLQAKVPKLFWADALRHSFHSFDSFLCKTPLGFKAPSAILGFRPVNLSTLHPFGCLSWYKVPEANRKKLDPKGRAAMLLSYLFDGNGYCLWDLGKCQVVKSRDVVFQDFTFPYTTELSATPPAIQEEIVWPQLTSEAVPALPTKVSLQQTLTPDMPLLDVQLEPRFDLRLSTSIHAVPTSPAPSSISLPSPQEPDIPEAPTEKPDGVVLITLPPLPDSPSPQPQGNPIAPSGIVSVPDSPNTGHAPSSPPRQRSGRERRAPDHYGRWAKSAKVDKDLDTPKTWRQLLNSPHKARWLKAADDEFASLLGMNTWKLVPRPHKRKVIKSKWVFKIKRRPNRSIQKLKGRLVAMGYTQVHANNWKGRQVDFKTAFLNGWLDEPVHMEQPPGFANPHHPDWVCEVSRSIYGLKQSPRQWNIELHKALLELGLTNSKYDPTLYFRVCDNNLVGALTIHVDDLAIIGEPSFVDDIILALGERFTIGANEDIHHFLSMKITRNVPNRHVFMLQSHYINELCERFLDGKHTSVSTPTDTNFKRLHRRWPEERPSSGPYNQLIGSLLCLSQCTHPNVAFAVNRLSQHLRDPSEAHWHAGVWILNYLVSTKLLKLKLGGKLDCCGYSNLDWAEERDDRRSTSAYTYCVSDGAILWKSQKQATVSLLSTEAEYEALSDSCKEGLWLRHLLTELCLQPDTPIPLHVDNEGAEALAKNPKNHARTKHIHAHYHFIRECVQDDKISLLHVSTHKMLADMLTKPLNRVLLEKNWLRFGLVDL